MTANPAYSFESNVVNQYVGFNGVTTVGDVNGDGYSDVIALGGIGATTSLYLFLGGQAGPTLCPGFPVTVLTGCNANAAGDVNGDGRADVAMGISNSFGGTVEVLFGTATGLDIAHPWTFTQSFAGGFGQNVAPAGDVNGDGYDDLIVGSPQMGSATFCPAGSNQGRVDVFFGSSLGPRTDNIWTLWGCSSFPSGTQLGTAIGTAGDVNADGFDDIVIGGLNVAAVVYGSGAGLPIQPNSGGRGWLSGATIIHSFNAFDGTGLGMIGAGDLNGDGFADVVVASPFDDTFATDGGMVRAFLGSASGLQTGSVFWSEASADTSGHFGQWMSSAGDVNGDGFADVLVGEASRVSVFQSNGQILFGTLNPFLIGSGLRSFGTAGDVDGDGLSDIVLGDGSYANGESFEGHLLFYAGRNDGLATLPNWSFKTLLSNTNLGYSVSSAGDVNGDGLDDFLSGAPTLPNLASPGEVNNGGVFLNFGNLNGPTPNFSDWSWVGANGDEVGSSVAPAYDINGDGYGDFIAGADPGAGGPGKAYVWYGHANPWSSTAPPNVTLNGTLTGGQFGAAVAAGDFNGDGYADVAVGAPLDDALGMTAVGEVFVYLGGAAGLSTTPALTLSGSQAGEHFGIALVADADVNGDGYTDLVVGAPQHNGFSFNGVGAMYVYFGGLSPVLTFAGAPQGRLLNMGLGRVLAHAGDVNGDGYGDIVTGMPLSGTYGRAEVFAGGPLGLTRIWDKVGFEANGAFGSGVCSAGDVNGDGLSDIAVSALWEDGGGAVDRGSVRVFLGPLANNTDPAAWTAFGTLDTQNLGSIACAGDVDGDGWSDLLVGSPGFNQNLPGQGLVQLFQGSAGVAKLNTGGASSGGHRVPLLSLASAGNMTLGNFTASAAGRTHVKMQWDVRSAPKLFPPPLSGMQSAYTLTGVPGTLGSLAFMLQSLPTLPAGAPLSWRMRGLTRSIYFPTTRWFSPALNGWREYDLRTPGHWAGVDDGPTVAGGLEMAAPWPNPARVASAISFTLPSAGPVRLTLLDLGGRHVRTLARQTMTAGRHEISWDGLGENGRRAMPGIYFFKLEAAGSTMSRKVALMP